MNRKQNINRKLKMQIVGSGLTNYQIELEAGIPLTKLSRFIHGCAIPSEEEKERIAKTLDTDPSELFQPVSLIPVEAD